MLERRSRVVSPCSSIPFEADKGGVNARSILYFLLALVAGFVGVVVFVKSTARGIPSTVDPTTRETGELGGTLDPPGVARRPVQEPTTPVSSRGGAAVELPLAYEEPSLEELARYRAHVGPGRLEGLVLAGKGPVPEAPVHVWQEGERSSSDGELVPPPGAWSTTTSDEGTFELTGLSAGRYRVLVEWGTARQEMPFEMKEGIGSKRLVCVFGLGTISGRVSNPSGVPLIGARVSASALGPWIGGDGRILHARTGADGFYRLDGLVEGRYWVSAHHKELPGGALDDHPQVRLSAGASCELDLGHAVSGVLGGMLLDADGRPVEGPRLLLLREVQRGVERRFLSDLSGSFHEPLPPGTYEVQVGFQNQIQLAAGKLTMPAGDLQQDIVAPTRPIVFQPTCLDGTQSDRQLAVELAGEFALVGESGTYVPELPRASGELRFYGLPAGRYEVRAGETYLVDTGGEPVQLTPEYGPAPRRMTLYRR